ncbi:MAG: hypothetical protein ACYTGZ_10495 [Planctomycetota bacterium]|jgi:hypothetical protein
MDRIGQLFLLLNFKTLALTVVAVLATYVCIETGLEANFPLTVIAIGVVFPIVFSIGGAYKRREVVLREYGTVKAHGRSIYFATRDWLSPQKPEAEERVKELLGALLGRCRDLFTGDPDDLPRTERAVYHEFSEVSRFIRDDLRGNGLAGGEVSRCNQFLSKMLVAFENVKHIYQYRTPRTLRCYSSLFMIVLPLLYGPYFAYLAGTYSPGLAYVIPVLFTVILVSLDNIQAHLENPFDQVGEDDVAINVEKFVASLDA